MKKKASETKCIAVHLPVTLLDMINEAKARSGESQTGFLTSLLEKGLGITKSERKQDKVYFFVKVRVNPTKVPAFGQKLQSGELDTSLTIMTLCSKEEPTIGFSFWQADSPEHFESVFSKHREYYSEVLEVKPVITPMDAMKLILA